MIDHDTYDAQGNGDRAFEHGVWKAAQYTRKLQQWVEDFHAAPKRVCWKCGDTDGVHDWYFLPSGHHAPMCEPCFASAVKHIRELEAQGYDF